MWPTDTPIGVLDQNFDQSTRLDSFAHTNTLLYLSQARPAICLHFWAVQNTVILGMQDLKLPDLAAGLSSLHEAGYAYFVRNSGGLGVISDAQVLNVSLFLPNALNLTIDAAYQMMTDFIVASFGQEQSIAHFEIADSYCPGSYDLSINGQKFAGIAQRRTKNGLVVMLYLSVSGDQAARGQTMATFYRRGLAQNQDKFAFPTVNPDSMANLDDLLHRPLTLSLVKQTLLNTLAQQGLSVDTQILPTLLATPAYQTRYQTELNQLQQRNQLLL